MVSQATGTNLGTSGISDPAFRQLGEFVVATMERLHVPGVAVGILHNGVEHVAGFGITSVEAPVSVDPNTLFQIGSTSKTFTGTVAMRLVEQGKLDLDTPVRTYLPDLKLQDEDVAAKVTLGHLFNHTGGWLGDYFDDTGMGDDALAIIVQRMARLPQWTPLGQVVSYNNAGYYLAGRVIEVVTGKPFEAVVKEMIFDPLGMDQSFFFANDCISRRTAVGHTVQDDTPAVARPWALARAAHAAGGIASSVRDQLKYARFQMGDGTAPDGTRLLQRASMDEMQSATTPAGSSFGAFGVTWMVKTLDGVKTVRHGGTTNGQLSAFVLVPERNFAITVLTNANRGGELHGDTLKWALRHYLDIGEAEPERLNLTEAELAPYAGHYAAALSELDITVKEGALVLQAIPKGGFPDKDSKPGPTPPPTRIALCQDELVVALDPPFKDARGEFLRDADGAIGWIRFGGRIAKRQG
jgi:CubicO group peptidase (beta-lactamase class C family)